MREIVPGVLTWSWFAQQKGYDFNGHLIRDAGGNLCIDPVEPDEATLDAIAREGAARVLLTNRNHFRAAMKVAERTGARIAIHPADAAFAKSKGVRIDDELAADQRIGPLRVIAAPGKSPGEVALHWPERRVLIVGDACVGNPPGALSLLPAAVIDDSALLRSSLKRLADLDFDALLVGDGASILEGANRALRKLVETF